MEVTKWLKPLVEHKLHAIPECQLTVEPAVHWFSTYDRSWPIVADQEPRISGVFRVWGTATLGGKPTFANSMPDHPIFQGF